MVTKRKRKVSCPKLPMQRQLAFASEGRFFDLQEIFNKLNEKYFRNKMRGYTIAWGRKRKQKPREYFVFGSIQEEDKIIRIHSLLDARFVPTWFLEYVIYHEMLHAFVPDQFDKNGRRLVHHDDFNRQERKFHFYRRAKKWEEENLARFLQ